MRTRTEYRLVALSRHAYATCLAIAAAAGLIVGVPTASAKLGLLAGFITFVLLRLTGFPNGWIAISRATRFWRQIRRVL